MMEGIIMFYQVTLQATRERKIIRFCVPSGPLTCLLNLHFQNFFFIFLILPPHKLGVLTCTSLTLRTMKFSGSFLRFCTGKRPIVRPDNMKGKKHPVRPRNRVEVTPRPRVYSMLFCDWVISGFQWPQHVLVCEWRHKHENKTKSWTT